MNTPLHLAFNRATFLWEARDDDRTLWGSGASDADALANARFAQAATNPDGELT